MNLLNIQDIFGPKGLLAEKLPGFEYRQGQEQMAEAVLEALNDGGKLVVEAGTGTGKTLAYLVPAVLSGRKIVVSTGTKNLQDQILSKEMPFLKKHLFPDLRAVCLKGKRNYICLHKWNRLQMQGELLISDQIRLLPRIRAWINETGSGDRAELEWLPEDNPLWNNISSSAEQCLGALCQEAESCFVNLLRKAAARAHIVVVNHHLLFSDIAVRDSGYGEVIPRYEAVVFDEAHHLEDVATSYLGSSISDYRLLGLTRDAEQEVNAVNLPAAEKMQILTRLGEMRGNIERLFNSLPISDSRIRLKRSLREDPTVGPLIEALYREMLDRGKEMDNLSEKTEICAPVAKRFCDLANELNLVCAVDREDVVYWMERRQRSTSITASPLDVSGMLQNKLYGRLSAAVFTSATIAAQGKFDFFKMRLGLGPETPALALTSPFDYARNTLAYIPRDLPEPGSAIFAEAIAKEIEEILEASSGRALVLFTSYRNMDEVYQLIKDRSQYRILIQGERPRAALLRAFREDRASVLFATSSFWEGIDVPGESLSCVIIEKLPFAVPSDPIIESRLESLEKAGRNAFMTYQVPLAILSLRQGFGRLIRSGSDRGVFVILDVRTIKRHYGRNFLQSLPSMPLTHDREDIKKFF
ncbi:MAG: ATP-dependent DNA helicase [Pseudomonadota bacterium]